MSTLEKMATPPKSWKMCRLPKDIAHRLKLAAAVRDIPMYRLVEELLLRYEKTNPSEWSLNKQEGDEIPVR